MVAAGAVFADNIGDLRDRLDGANLVVREHDAGKHRLRPQGVAKLIDQDSPTPIAADERHLKAQFFQVLGDVQPGVVLDGGGDHVVPGARPPQSVGDTQHGGVDALGAAAGEEHFRRPGVQALRHLPTGGVHRFLRLAPHRIEPAGVAETAFQVGEHGLQRLRQQRRGGSVVKVDHSPNSVAKQAARRPIAPGPQPA